MFAAGAGEGTHFAVCEVLEQQGVRWFMPRDLGTVIPEKKAVTIAEQEMAQAPSFANRWFQMPDMNWQVRVRCGRPLFPGAHGLPGVPPFKTEPELYALMDGKRSPRQHCVANPKVLNMVVREVVAGRKRGAGTDRRDRAERGLRLLPVRGMQ